MAITLCLTDDIPEGGARGFELPEGKVIAVKKRQHIFLYLNRCPHSGLPLEWQPNEFMDAEGLYIKCSNHGAIFIPETGQCIQGPCLGDSLWCVDYQIDNGKVIIDEEELPALPGQV